MVSQPCQASIASATHILSLQLDDARQTLPDTPLQGPSISQTKCHDLIATSHPFHENGYNRLNVML